MQILDEEHDSGTLDEFGTSPRVSTTTENRMSRFATLNYAKGINISDVTH